MKLRDLKIFIFLILIVSIPLTTFATTGEVGIKSNINKVKKGETFIVTLYAISKDGINGINTKYKYDSEKLELINAELVDTLNWCNLSNSTEIAIISNSTNSIKNADVYILKFKVKDNANIGDTLKIETSNILLDTDAKTNSELVIAPKKIEIEVTEKPMLFSDIKQNAWYYNAVNYVYQNDIIKGYNQTTYAPEDKLTRAMMITILYRMDKSPKVNEISIFKDIQNRDEWYYNAVTWAANNKIASGYDDGNFGPNDNITREQLAVFLYKYAKFKGKNVSERRELTYFKDGSMVSNYAKEQMKWATAKGVITGNDNTNPPTLNPIGTATRAEAAAMLYKYCNKIGK